MGTARTDDEGGEGVRKDRCEEVVTRKSVAVALARYLSSFKRALKDVAKELDARDGRGSMQQAIADGRARVHKLCPSHT